MEDTNDGFALIHRDGLTPISSERVWVDNFVGVLSERIQPPNRRGRDITHLSRANSDQDVIGDNGIGNFIQRAGKPSPTARVAVHQIDRTGLASQTSNQPGVTLPIHACDWTKIQRNVGGLLVSHEISRSVKGVNGTSQSFRRVQLRSEDGHLTRTVRPCINHRLLRRSRREQRGPFHIQVLIVVHDIALEYVGVVDFARRHQKHPICVGHRDFSALNAGATDHSEFNLSERNRPTRKHQNEQQTPCHELRGEG